MKIPRFLRRRKRRTLVQKSSKPRFNFYTLRRRLTRCLPSLLRSLMFAGLLAGLVLAAAASYLLQIKTVKLQRGDGRVQLEQLAGATAQLRGRNILLLGETTATRILQLSNPTLSRVELVKTLPDAIVLTAYSYPLLLRWQCIVPEKSINQQGQIVATESVRTLLINTRGHITLPDGETDSEALLQVLENDTCPQRLGRQQQLFTPEMLRQFEQSRTVLGQLLGEDIQQLVFYRAARELHLQAAVGVSYWVDLQLPLSDQFEKLAQVRATRGEQFAPSEHVDLRVPNKIFYK